MGFALATGGVLLLKYLEGIGHHLFSARGELIEVLRTQVDVTDRKHAEKHERLPELESTLAHMNRLSIMGKIGCLAGSRSQETDRCGTHQRRWGPAFLGQKPTRPGRGQGSARPYRRRCRPSRRYHRPDP